MAFNRNARFKATVNDNPAPGNYEPKKEYVLSKSPAAAMMKSVEVTKLNKDPGPGQYENLAHSISKGLRQNFTMQGKK